MWSLEDTESAQPAPRRKKSARSGFLSRSGAHRGEEDDLAHALGAGQQHHQAIDSNADAAGRRHALLERADEILVVGLGLLVAPLQLGRLLIEAATLLVGIV